MAANPVTMARASALAYATKQHSVDIDVTDERFRGLLMREIKFWSTFGKMPAHGLSLLMSMAGECAAEFYVRGKTA